MRRKQNKIIKKHQNGEGLREIVTEGLRKVGEVTNFIQKPQFGDEIHVRGYNYLGPKTEIDLRERLGKPFNVPINSIDAAAKTHDYAYKRINDEYKEGKINPAKYKEEVSEADRAFIEELKKIPDLSVDGHIAMKAIALKKWLEKTMHMDLLGMFPKEGGGFKTILKPNRQLIKEKNGIMMNGGFLPALLPLIEMGVSALGSAAVSKIIDHFTNKEHEGGFMGSGIQYNKNLDDNIKRIYLIHALDHMGSGVQIEKLHNVIFDNKK